MSKKLYEESNLQAIANAIREKNNTQNQYTPSQMSNAILQIHGEPDLETLTVTENGNYLPSANKDGFSEVTVSVPSGGGGTTNILSGTTEPTSGDGSDGDIYLCYISNTGLVTNVRMVIYGVRGYNSDTQVSEVQLLDSNGDVIPWGSGIATSNGQVYSSSQTAEKAFDNIANDKWYTSSKPSSSNPIWVDFELSTPIVYSDIDAWQWWTADDTVNRDPINFSLQVSFNGGHTYYTVDEASGASIAGDRNAVAYTHTISAIDNGIIRAYCKVNGTWQDLIGTVIDDVNVGNNNV